MKKVDVHSTWWKSWRFLKPDVNLMSIIHHKQEQTRFIIPLPKSPALVSPGRHHTAVLAQHPVCGWVKLLAGSVSSRRLP
jgi:hypothetical protein